MACETNQTDSSQTDPREDVGADKLTPREKREKKNMALEQLQKLKVPQTILTEKLPLRPLLLSNGKSKESRSRRHIEYALLN